MNVTLVNYTQNAKELLILSKNTRHLSSDTRLDDVFAMTDEEKDQEIGYIFNTISSSWEFVNYTFLLQNVSRQFCLEKGSKIITKVNHKSARKRDDKSFHLRGAKKVEDIVVGDEVMSFNIETSEKEWDKVIFTSKHMSNDWYSVEFSNSNGIKCTNEHPFYIVNRIGGINFKPKWISAEDLKIGDQAVQIKYLGYGSRTKSRGVSLSERCGSDTAEKIKNSISRSNSRTYKERFGGDADAEALKRTKHLKGRTYEEILGSETAKRLKEKRVADTKIQHRNNPNLSDGLAESARSRWKSNRSEMIDMCRLARSASILKNPTKKSSSEDKLDDILQSEFQGEFLYTGNGAEGVQIGFRVPDFININGKKKIIELFGCWWHGCKRCFPNKKRKDHKYDNVIFDDYNKFGFDCLVIWEHEMNDVNALKDKIRTFIHNPDVELVEIKSIERSDISRYSFNIETEKNHNFFVYGILTHNTHQLVRHRIGTSFAQQSLRVSSAESFSYFIPDSVENDQWQATLYGAAMANTQDSYNLLLHKGTDIQDARCILPIGICTNILLGINLRALSLLMETRLCVRAQGEFQQAAMFMKSLVAEVHPWADKVLLPHCVLKGRCQFPNFDCPLSRKHKHLRPVETDLNKNVENDWKVLMDKNYCPQPEQKGGERCKNLILDAEETRNQAILE